MPVSATMVQSIVLVISTSGAIAGYLAKLWYDHRRTLERVVLLESKLEKVEGECMKAVDHERSCVLLKDGMYKDVSALEGAIKRIEHRLDRGEEIRDLARTEDSKWKEEISKQVTEIGTLLKTELSHLRRYEGP